MNILIRKDEVKKYGNEIIQYSNDFLYDIKKFSSLIDSINTAWRGNEAVKYMNVMKEKYLPIMNSINNDIKAYGKYLRDVPGAYQILEDIYTSRKINI